MAGQNTCAGMTRKRTRWKHFFHGWALQNLKWAQALDGIALRLRPNNAPNSFARIRSKAPLKPEWRGTKAERTSPSRLYQPYKLGVAVPRNIVSLCLKNDHGHSACVHPVVTGPRHPWVVHIHTCAGDKRGLSPALSILSAAAAKCTKVGFAIPYVHFFTQGSRPP